jgi:DNA-binding GntR family transcriptional regulator
MPTVQEHDPPATLAELAYTLIKQRIFNFELMPGDRFSELELAQQVQVSRTPLRQALQRLQREGFMQVFPKSGWLVVPLDFDQFDELYDFRVLIECFAVRHLCEADERPSLKALAEVWLVPAGYREPDGQRVGELDEAFHSELVAASGNREGARRSDRAHPHHSKARLHATAPRGGDVPGARQDPARHHPAPH